jgi:IgGFc binding protein
MGFLSRLAVLAAGSLAAGALAAGGCSAAGSTFTAGTGGTTATGTGAGGAGGATSTSHTSSGTGGAALFDAGATGGAGGAMPMVADPTTCAEALADHTYIGCDFWPTVTANNVWSIFDFAVVVANAGTQTANVTVSQAGTTIQTVTVAPDALTKIYLPWVPSLKGGDSNDCGQLVAMPASVSQTQGAYHLVSDTPVTVYQFSALEYAPTGGPPGKDWSTCPGSVPGGCTPLKGCYSFTNDASLLLPTPALTGNYRITSQAGWPGYEGAFFTLTGTAANTQVTVYVAPGGHVIGDGNRIADTPGGGILTFTLGAGDVAELVGDSMADNAGSLVKASAPVQVISGMPCAFQPYDAADIACDHLEQTVLPAETLGKHYFVSPPTSPHGTVVGHIVRIVGNVDGTSLNYPSGLPAGAPETIDAGQVVELSMAGPGYVTAPFEVAGDHEFAVATFMLGATLTDPSTAPPDQLGDPSQSNAITVEQYRLKYVFLAPTDYTESWADVTQPMGATVTIEGAVVTTAPTPISSGYGINRVPLGPGNNGAHVLTSTLPVGLQVIGYGAYTSYQYPGGLNLDLIAPPPPPPT